MSQAQGPGPRAPVPETQLLGKLGMFGGFIYWFTGVQMLISGRGQDRLTDIAGVIWALCWVVAGWGLQRQRVTGTSLTARIISTLLVVGFAAASLWGVHRLIDPDAADHGPFAIAPMIVVLGMIGTGVLCLRAALWAGWRRFVPLYIALVYVTTIVITGVTGAYTLPYAFILAGVGYAILGDSLRRLAS